MKAILFAFFVLLFAVTNIASLPAHAALPHSAVVQAEGVTPGHSLDMKTTPAASSLSEQIVDTLPRRVTLTGTRRTPWSAVNPQLPPLQMFLPSFFSWVFYPMRN